MVIPQLEKRKTKLEDWIKEKKDLKQLLKYNRFTYFFFSMIGWRPIPHSLLLRYQFDHNEKFDITKYDNNNKAQKERSRIIARMSGRVKDTIMPLVDSGLLNIKESAPNGSIGRPCRKTIVNLDFDSLLIGYILEWNGVEDTINNRRVFYNLYRNNFIRQKFLCDYTILRNSKCDYDFMLTWLLKLFDFVPFFAIYCTKNIKGREKFGFNKDLMKIYGLDKDNSDLFKKIFSKSNVKSVATYPEPKDFEMYKKPLDEYAHKKEFLNTALEFRSFIAHSIWGTTKNYIKIIKTFKERIDHNDYSYLLIKINIHTKNIEIGSKKVV